MLVCATLQSLVFSSAQEFVDGSAVGALFRRGQLEGVRLKQASVTWLAERRNSFVNYPLLAYGLPF